MGRTEEALTVEPGLAAPPQLLGDLVHLAYVAALALEAQRGHPALDERLDGGQSAAVGDPTVPGRTADLLGRLQLLAGGNQGGMP